jgi:Cys-rich repeat protein
MFIDVTQTTHFAYVAGNGRFYKVPIPLSGTTVYSTPLYRHADETTPQSLAIAPTSTVTIPWASEPIGSGFAWNGLLYMSSGYGSALSGGSVGAPVSAGTLMPTLSGGFEQYGCAASAEAPFLSGVTASYGALTETGAILDFEGGNLYFGYDTGGATPTGGLVQYPPASTNPSAWSCPSPTTFGSACGSTTACVGSPPSGKCVNDSDCSGATPYCDIFPDSSFGTCVACRTDQQCPQPAGAFEVCDTNNCVNTTDDPDYTTTLTQCNTTAGTTQYGLCGLCVSNAACAALTSTPVCDQKNAASTAFGTCVECTSDSDCAANDEYENAGLTHCDQNSGSPNFDHCAACSNNSQCGAGQVCDTSTPSASTTYFDTCVACDSASVSSCGGGQVCDTVLGDATYDQCVTACTPAGSSNAPANNCGLTAPVCAASGGCVQCTTNAQCPGNAGNPALVCNVAFVCECEAASDCPGGAASGATCQNNVCVP